MSDQKLTPGMRKLLDVALAVRCPDDWCQAGPGESCRWSGPELENREASLARCLLALLRLIEAAKEGK